MYTSFKHRKLRMEKMETNGKIVIEMSQKLSQILTFTKKSNNIKDIAKTAAQIFKL